MESFQILSFKSKEGPGVACQLAVCLSNNSVDVLDAAAGYASVTKLEMAGHRSD
ncbi:hypothetical protein HaLaN_18653, partial [Haematococcus lacustris]